MNPKLIVLQAESKAKEQKKKSEEEHKKMFELMLPFAKKVIELLMYINNSKSFRFSAEAYPPIKEKCNKLFYSCPFDDRSIRNHIIGKLKENGFVTLRTTGMDYVHGLHLEITLRCTHFNPIVSFIYKGNFKQSEEYHYNDFDKFAESFTEKLIALRIK